MVRLNDIFDHTFVSKVISRVILDLKSLNILKIGMIIPLLGWQSICVCVFVCDISI